MTSTELALLVGTPAGPSLTRARRVLRRLWHAPLSSPLSFPSEIPDVSARVLDALRAQVSMPPIALVSRSRAEDGTTKLLLESHDGARFESVIIPGKTRTSVCVSSQAGCSRDCRFCATASLGLTRNLRAGEIVAQVLLARAMAGKPLRNIVFMGMGEPLDNLKEVVKAVDVLGDPGGAAFSPKHITVSTSGVLPAMRLFADRSPACLALSLNAGTEEKRRDLMPITRRWSLSSLFEFMRSRPERLFFIEYILIGGENDSRAERDALIEHVRSLDARNVRINLIPYNPHPFAPYRGPGKDRVQAWFEALNAVGLRTMVRRPRGPEIAAACGQLAGRVSNRSDGSKEKSPCTTREAVIVKGSASMSKPTSMKS